MNDTIQLHLDFKKKEEELHEKRKRKKLELSLLSILFLLTTMSLFFFSPKKYVLFMILCMILSTLFGCYLVYILSNPYRELIKSSYLLHLLRSSNSEELFGTLLTRTKHTREGVSGVLLTFHLFDGKEREIFDPFDDFSSVPLNTKCHLVTGGGCLIHLSYSKGDVQ